MNHEGMKLSKAVRDLNISRTEFAEKLGVTRSTIYAYFGSEKLSASVKKNILNQFGIDINAMAGAPDTDKALSKIMDDMQKIINDYIKREQWLRDMIDDLRK